MTRVLHIHFGKEGGAERFFVNLATAFDKRGVEQRFVIRPNRSWGDAIAALGPVRHSNFQRLSPMRSLVRAHIRKTCRDWQPDAVMAWMHRAAQALPPSHDGVRLCRLGDYPANLKHFDNCDVVVGNVPGIAQRLDDLGWSGGRTVVSNFPKPVTPRPVSRADHDTPEDVPLLVTGGRFVPRKGMDIAIRAAARIPGLWLWLIGDGQERAALEALARELGIADRTRFIGWVDETIHYIAAGNLFLLPSRHEPLGNILLEAWQAGVPAISTRCEGPSWFMRDGVDGPMVDIDDIDATVTALQALLDDPARAQRHAASATERLQQMFTEDAIVDEYMRLFAMTPSEARALR
ncbi:GDP-mannose-dependent alpha-(1-6)-phosphatidylinositol monomannoside mannosyltransferase [Rhodobacteraceae bacterium THAF1]|uniref:glycosyltransferase n=1 Tax=Palleronia sp. THAF1 TaxID=2587842 RepID=UPI000F3CD5FB|nr:glycosyltransferase [Palleronia sp. THAF1]QFU09890.1 GDP-mannose-dependent alpha-(1-6)-phosphatidylinositol monomannoside mannosyltransferase [Palleronia sp. THAF1]VDC17207.1 GDP-mannose-dependent alpha-(1-6)-phosphatidylinositol monomannoside mannosyltransferase [Rhodobacteraceae bacterium THAF1]